MVAFDTDPHVPDDDTVIWRYVESAKFTDLLGRFCEHAAWSPERPGTRPIYFQDPGNLWFSYPSTFGDCLEATHPWSNDDPEEYVELALQHMELDDAKAQRFRDRVLQSNRSLILQGVVSMAELCGISCWTAAEDERLDMWGFAGKANGVALRSTCHQVSDALGYAHNRRSEARPSICAAGYVDHRNYFLPHDGFRGILAIVQSSHSTENEVRFVAKSAALAAIRMKITKPGFVDALDRDEENAELERIVTEANSALEKRKMSGSNGFHLPVRLEGMIREVIVSPFSEKGYEQTVMDQLREVGLTDVPVRRTRF